jgi:glycolate oxidase FAD binding subunit
VAEFNEIIGSLAGCVGPGHVKTDEVTLAAYGVDGMTPKAVVFPNNTEQVSGVVKIARNRKWAVLPRGAGTKINTGNPPDRLDMVVCLKRMNHMKDVDVANLTLTVEAGVRFRDIQARLATQEDRCYLPLEDLEKEAEDIVCSDRSHSGCFFPLDPPLGEKATIGGVMATNSSGPKALYYNQPRDLILGAKIVDPNGNVVGTGGKTVKNVSGYDVSKLMLGSYGSLGIICEMTLRLLPLPEAMSTGLYCFKDFAGAAGFADELLGTGMLPAAVEVMDGASYQSLDIREAPATEGGWIAAVAMEHFEPAVERMKKDCLEMARRCGATGSGSLDSEETHSLFWLKVGDLIPIGAEPEGKYVSLKLNYPISCWKDVAGFAAESLEKTGARFKILAHAGTGICLVTVDISSGDGVVSETAGSLLGKCREQGGNMIVLSAPTRLKAVLSVWGETGSDFILMQRLKKRLDSARLMCPGRYVGGL